MRRGLRITTGLVAVPAVGLALLSAGEMAGVLRDGGDGPAGTGANGGAIVLPDAVRRAAEREARGVPVEVVAAVPRSGATGSTPSGASGDPSPAPTSSSREAGPSAGGERPGASEGDDEASAGDSTVSGARVDDRPADAPAAQGGQPAPAPATPAPAPAAGGEAVPPASGAIGAASRRKLRLSVKSLDRIPATESAPAALQLGVSVLDEGTGKAASGLPETVSVKVAVPAVPADQPATGSAASLHVRLAMLDSRTAPGDDAPLTAADVALRVRLAFSDSEVDKPVLKRTSADDEAVSSTLHVWVPLEKAPAEEPGQPGEPGEQPGEGPGQPGGDPAPAPQPEPLPVEDPEETAEEVETPDAAPAIDVVVPVSDLTPGEPTSHEVEVPVADPSAPAPSAPVTVEVGGTAPPAEPETVADPAPAQAPTAEPRDATAPAAGPEDGASADGSAPADEPAS